MNLYEKLKATKAILISAGRNGGEITPEQLAILNQPIDTTKGESLEMTGDEKYALQKENCLVCFNGQMPQEISCWPCPEIRRDLKKLRKEWSVA